MKLYIKVLLLLLVIIIPAISQIKGERKSLFLFKWKPYGRKSNTVCAVRIKKDQRLLTTPEIKTLLSSRTKKKLKSRIIVVKKHFNRFVEDVCEYDENLIVWAKCPTNKGPKLKYGKTGKACSDII